MPEPDFYLKQGDTAASISRVAKDADGVAVNLTGATIQFVMRPINSTTALVDAAANNDDVSAGTRGNMSYDWADGDTDTAGLMAAEWEVTFADDTIQTYPNGGYDLILISPQLGSAIT